MAETTTEMMIRTEVGVYTHDENAGRKVSPQFRNVRLYCQADLEKLVPGNRIRFNSGARAIFWRNRDVELDEKSRAVFVHYRFELAYEFIDLPQPHPEKQISTFNILHNQEIRFPGDGRITFSIFGFGKDYSPIQGINYEEARFLYERGREKRRK